MASEGEDNDNDVLADPVLDVDNGDAADMGGITEDEEAPKKARKVERGDTREVIRTHRKAVMKVEKEGAWVLSQSVLIGSDLIVTVQL